MTNDAAAGVALSRNYFHEIVRPIMSTRLPNVLYAAGRLGAGSDVLGLDDATSRDHDWGLRLSLFVPDNEVERVDSELERTLPDSYQDLPTRFAFTGQTAARHHIEVSTVSRFAKAQLDFDPRAGPSVPDWLSLSGQAVLEVVAGPVFTDRTGELDSLRRALEWYPDDIWRYVLACDWARIAHELPLIGRAADVGDDIGSRIITARLTHVVMHLAFMLERHWPPYAKWFGSLFRALPCAPEVGAAIDEALHGDDPRSRHHGIADALESLLRLQNRLGLTDTVPATVPFWDRPFLHPNPAIITQLLGPIVTPDVRALPQGRGAIEQRTDNVDILVNPRARRLATTDYGFAVDAI